MKDKHYAYLAGTLDGDGCINASVAESGGVTWYRLHLSVNCVNGRTIRRLADWFGGSATKRNRPHYKNGYIWEWRLVVKQDVKTTLLRTLPFIAKKKQQVQLALQFLDLPRGCPEARHDILRDIQSLNQRRTAEGELTDIGKMRWPYLAGLMDTEGTFTVRKDNRENGIHYGIWARFANTDKHLLDWIEKFFGGTVFGDEASYYWCLPHERKDKERFLLHLLPYLITKKEQAKILLAYIRMGDTKDPVAREALYQQCYSFNHPST